MNDPYQNPEEMLKTYNLFKQRLNEDDIEGAYEILKSNPQIIIYFSPLEAGRAYDDIRNFLGKEEAGYVSLLFAQECLETLSSMQLTLAFANRREAENLEKILNTISKKHKKMLEDLGKEE